MDYLQEFATFWRKEVKTLNCIPYPKKAEDIPFTQRLLLENYQNGELYEKMFGNANCLPADVLVRYQAGQNIPQDEKALFDAGLCQAATTARVRGEQLDDQLLVSQAELGRKQYLEAKKRSEYWADASFGERLGIAPPSPEAIAEARETWGITGKPDWKQ